MRACVNTPSSFGDSDAGNRTKLDLGFISLRVQPAVKASEMTKIERFKASESERHT